VRTLRQDVPTGLVQVLDKALAREPEARYRSCREMQADLERFLIQHGEPVGAMQIAEWVKQLIEASTEDSLPGSPSSRSGSGQPSTTPASQSDAATVKTPEPKAPPAEVQAPSRPAPDDTSAMEPAHPEVRQRRGGRHAIVLAALLLLGVGGYGAWWAQRVPAPVLPTQPPTAYVPPPVHVSPPGVATPEPSSDTRPRASVPTPAVQPPPSKPAAPGGSPEIPSTPTASPGGASPAVAAAPSASSTAPAPGSGSIPVAQATLRVVSNPPGKVFLGEESAGETPLVLTVDPGRQEVEVAGTHEGDKFDVTQVVELKAGETREVSFSLRRVAVTLRGRPEELKVVAVDGKPHEGGGQVSIYEGHHLLKLLDPDTGKTYTAECEVRLPSQLCKFNVDVEE
jgi:serine/threonine-protein kinase